MTEPRTEARRVADAPAELFGPPAAPTGARPGNGPAPRRVSKSGSLHRPVPRRARLSLTRIDPWSVLKAALVFATCLFIVWMAAVIVLYNILQGAGVFDSVNQTLSDVLGTHLSFRGPVIIGGAAVLGALNVVLIAALATVAAFAYNLTSSLVGGVEVTLAERDS